MKDWLVTILVWCLLSFQTHASDSVLSWAVKGEFEDTYQRVYAALEEQRFFVVFEPNIHSNLAQFAERWGEDYNRNGLEGVRSMVFCNAWYANAVSNADPQMMALCPLHLTLVHKAGVTHILFVSPRTVARGSGAEAIAAELEAAVSQAINAVVAR